MYLNFPYICPLSLHCVYFCTTHFHQPIHLQLITNQIIFSYPNNNKSNPISAKHFSPCELRCLLPSFSKIYNRLVYILYTYHLSLYNLMYRLGYYSQPAPQLTHLFTARASINARNRFPYRYHSGRSTSLLRPDYIYSLRLPFRSVTMNRQQPARRSTSRWSIYTGFS